MKKEFLNFILNKFGPEVISTEPGQWRDICGFNLGLAVALALPRNEEEIQILVVACRQFKIPIAVVGERTAYWRPLSVGGCLALSLKRFRKITFQEQVVVVEAGVPVRELDQALRAKGYHLPIHPDAYGETSIGSLAAISCTSGIGMGNGPLSRWISGLRLIDGQGRSWSSGAWIRKGVHPFMREGFPDAGDIFLSAEGALGVITCLALRLIPAPYRAHARFPVSAEQIKLLADMAVEWGQSELYDTFRVVSEEDRGDIPQNQFNADMWVQSFVDEHELRHRVGLVSRAFQKRANMNISFAIESSNARNGRSPDYDQRWTGPMDEHRKSFSRHFFLGMDVNAPYSALSELLMIAEKVAIEQRKIEGIARIRRALYFAPNFVNVGFHSTVLLEPRCRLWAARHLRRWLDALSKQAVIPYRMGRVWPSPGLLRLEPSYVEVLRDIKKVMDPDNLFNRGYPLFDSSGEK